MYEVVVKGHFAAAHYLRHYQGKCENLHGHRFRVVVGLKGWELNESGMLYDFTVLKEKLHEVLGSFDHVCLNDLPQFKDADPSSENIARAIYDELKMKLFGTGAILAYVEVWESPDTGVRYTPSP